MDNSLSLVGKRALTIAVAAATILWSVGVSAFLPLTAQAYVAGDLIMGETLSTVYYYGGDGMRHPFPNEKTYFTWYTDFSDVETISDSTLASIPLGDNIVYRPGSRWIKITSDMKTYAVTPQGQIRWVESEAAAVDLAGSDWNTMIDDVPDVFFVDYTVGTSIIDASDAYNGALVDMDGTTWLVWNGEKREVTDAGFSANGFQTRFLLDGDGIDLAGLTEGSDVTGEENELSDAAQLGDEVTGGVSVSLASDTPASATVPAGANSVAFTKVKLTATSGSAEIDQLVFKLGGVGDASNLGDAYLYEGDVRVTDGRSINSSTREVTFSGLNIELSSGESVYLTLRADIAADPNGGDTASFALASESSVVGSATVSGSFPVSGNTMTFSETDAGTVTIAKTGSITDPVIGEEGAEIAKFRVEADSEGASVEVITVNVDEAGDHMNYELWQGDDLLASGDQNDDLVTFVLTAPLSIEDGDSETLTVTADIGGEADDTIGVAIEEEADVIAMGEDFGFNMSVDITAYDETGSACAASSDDCSFSTIEGGDLTFAFNGPTADDIQVDGEDQVLMEFTVTAGNWTEIQEIGVIVEDDGEDDDDDDDTGLKQDDSDVNLEDITIREEDGSTWMGPEELSGADSASDTTQTLTFDDTQILEAGESVDLMITADVEAGAPDDEVFHVELDMSTVVAEDANGDDLSEIVPGADIVGNNFTTSDSSLTVQVSTPPSTGSYVKGSSNVQVVGFSFAAGDASDVNVTDVTFNVDGDSDATWSDEADLDADDRISSCSIYDNESGSLIDGPVSPDTTGAGPFATTIEFSSFDWWIEAGESEKMVMKCNFANLDESGTDGDDDYVFYIEDDTMVTAEDEDGDDVTVGTISDANGNDPGGAETVIISIVDGGSITATLDGSSPASTIILGASTGVEIGKWKFDADNEPFIIDTLTFANGGQDDVAANVKLSCSDEAGTTVTETGFLSGGSVSFDNLECYVPTDVTKVVTVTIDTNTVSDTAASSGDTIALTLDTDSTGFLATGVSSGEQDTDAGTDSAAGTMTLRKTKPTVSLASGSPSGAGTPGLAEVFKFNVSADSRGFVQLNEVMFKVTSSDGAASGWNDCDAADLGVATDWEFYDAADSSTKLDEAGDWTFLDASGNDCTANEALAYAYLNLEGSATIPAEEIGAGETKTYVLRVDTTGASTTNDDTFRIDIPDETEANAVAAARDAIEWEDDEFTTEIDGSQVKNLPVTGGTIVY